jgi:hypothetical protein
MSASVYLVMSGLLWGTGGLTGTEFGHVTGLSALAVAAYRLLAGGSPYGRTAPSKLAAYQSSFCGIFSTSSPVCGASMM